MSYNGDSNVFYDDARVISTHHVALLRKWSEAGNGRPDM